MITKETVKRTHLLMGQERKQEGRASPGSPQLGTHVSS